MSYSEITHGSFKNNHFFASIFNLLQHSGYVSHRLLDTALMPNIAVVTSQ